MPRVDATHRGPLINVAAWITLITMIFLVISKVTTKWSLVRKFQKDDIYMILGALAAIAQCIAASIQVESGLGQPENTLSAQQFDHYQKATYASQILYVLTIYLAKVAELNIIITLTRPSLKQTVVRLTMCFIALWLVTAILCLSFQCNVPYTWNQASGHCFHLFAFWIANGAVDIITQILIALAPIYLFSNLQLPVAKKRLAMSAFIPCLTTIPLSILRLVYLSQASDSSDVTLDSFDAALVTEIHTNYSIIASCLPFLKPLVDALAIGLISNDIRLREDSGNVKDKINSFGVLGDRGFEKRNLYGWGRSQNSGNTEYISKITAGKHNDVELRGLERYGSQERMVINQTTTTVVTSDPAPNPSPSVDS